MKNLKKVLALVLAVVMVLGLIATTSAATYEDVKATDDYANAIDVLSNLKILNGFEENDKSYFKADATFTRAQAAKIVAIVHNAATNGKIKDQDAISALYANAQNPFVDCNSNWALPFINYCRITGLADGMTATTYEPNREVTGVQFLKLMLTTLNFDTAKEGYTGTGWDINVLNRANEIGLTAGMAKDWKAIAPIKRGEAAQILYNALTKYLVEYGQLVKNNYVNSVAASGTTAAKDGYYKSSFISNEQVAKSGYTLAEKMGVGLKAAHDVFMRPGYVWSYGTSWSAFYLNAAEATYTGKVTACEVLVDLGVPKTSNASVDYVIFRDGRAQHSNGSMTHKLNACEAAGTAIGGNGTLTQVYAVGDYYVITVIDTFLAKVNSVKKTTHGNPMSTNSNLTIWGQEGAKFSNVDTDVVASGLTAYAVDDYILTYVSVNPNETWYKNTAKAYVDLYTADAKIYNNETKATSKTTLASDETWPATNAPETIYLVDVQKAGTIASGKYTGRSLPDIDEIVINGEKVKTNCTYTLDEHGMGERVLSEDVLDFFVDQYGYAIGDLKPTSTSAYAVVDGIVWITNGASYSDKQFASASVIMAGADAASDVTVAKVAKNGNAPIATTGKEDGQGIVADATVSTVKGNNAYYGSNNHSNMHAVVKYTVDANGNYTLYYNESNVYNLCTTTSVPTVSATNPNLGLGTNAFGLSNVIRADEKTVFTVKTVVSGEAKYTSYTGIANVPTIKNAKAVVAVQENDATYASFIYVDASNAIFAGSTAIAFVTEDHRANFEDTTTRLSYYNVYINGVKTTVEVDQTLASTPVDIDRDIFKNGPGLYKLEFNSEGKVVAVTAIDLADAASGYHTGVIAATSDVVITLDAGNSAIENTGDTINHTGATIYVVNYDNDYSTGTAQPARYTGVSVGTAEDLAKGSTVFYKLVDGSTWMAETIYVLVANN